MSTSTKHQPEAVPHYGPVPRWLAVSGLGKTKTYELIRSGSLPTRKVGRRTLVDIRAGLAWLESQPSASAHAKRAA